MQYLLLEVILLIRAAETRYHPHADNTIKPERERVLCFAVASLITQPRHRKHNAILDTVWAAPVSQFCPLIESSCIHGMYAPTATNNDVGDQRRNASSCITILLPSAKQTRPV